MDSNKSTIADKIVFGSMRMLEYDYSKEYWINLFSELHDLGITTFHSSSEYESFPLFCSVLADFNAQYPGKKISHIVKLAEPHFHIHNFDSALLIEKIRDYCVALNTDSIFGLQWMWRGDLQDNAGRLERFNSQYPKIEKTVTRLKEQYLIQNFYCFPYDPDFAVSAISKPCVDGLVVYRNVLEQEHDPALALADTLGKQSYILRPLFAGKALEIHGQTPQSLVRWALDFPGVKGAILSISSLAKINDII